MTDGRSNQHPPASRARLRKENPYKLFEFHTPAKTVRVAKGRILPPGQPIEPTDIFRCKECNDWCPAGKHEGSPKVVPRGELWLMPEEPVLKATKSNEHTRSFADEVISSIQEEWR